MPRLFVAVSLPDAVVESLQNICFGIQIAAGREQTGSRIAILG